MNKCLLDTENIEIDKVETVLHQSNQSNQVTWNRQCAHRIDVGEKRMRAIHRLFQKSWEEATVSAQWRLEEV